ncbi:cupin-like domain-containing protein [Fimicolochytrium jonesii]|uniref:cupin-like domain-containing protein n=1 Tax=Fimicolochytrium jonesii TaxID=1396493 RepID=UPI0022FE810A|nr:cupin-like domain-containing protein [Fimicolochytrium jonesii]KAI8818651.1 cupin-like domain-containing protein [Fimicolochytrium jonesii]
MSWLPSLMMSAFALFLGLASPTVADATQLKLGFLWNDLAGNGAVALRTLKAAVAFVNDRTDILPNTTVSIVAEDSGDTKAQAVIGATNLVQRGIFAMIGPETSTLAPSSALVTSGRNLPNCLADVGTSAFENRFDYPNVFRMQVSTRVLGSRLIDFCNEMGWKKVAYIYSQQQFGGSWGPGVITSAQKHGIDLVVNQGWNGNGAGSDLESCVQSILKSKCRIIVVTAYEDELTPLWLRARELGLTGPDYAWITANGVIDFPGDYHTYDQSIAKVLGVEAANSVGTYVIGVPDPNYTSPEYNLFRDYYQRVALTEDPSRDIGNEYIAEDRIFDCAMAIFYGYHDYLRDHSLTTAVLANPNYTLPTMRDLANISIFTTNRQGLQGPYVFFDNGDYARKRIVLFPQLNGEVYAKGYQYPNAMTFVNDQVSLNASALLFSGSPVIPIDFPASKLLNPTWAEGQGLIVSIVSGTVLLSNAVSMTLVFVFRDKIVIKRAGGQSLMLIVLGLILLDVSPLLYVGNLTRAICIAQPLVLNVGFGLVFANLSAKTFRVYKVFNNPKMMERAIPSSQLFGFVAFIVLVEILLSVVWVTASTPVPTILTVNDFETVQACVSPMESVQHGMTIISLVFNGLLLTLTTILSYKTRGVVSTYNETKWIGISVYNIVAACALFLPLVYTTAFAKYAYLFRSIAVLGGTTVTQICIYMPKFVVLINPPDKARRLQQEAGNASGRNPNSINVSKIGISPSKQIPTTVRRIQSLFISNVPTLQISGNSSHAFNWNWAARWKIANVTAVSGYLCVESTAESERDIAKMHVYRTANAVVRHDTTNFSVITGDESQIGASANGHGPGHRPNNDDAARAGDPLTSLRLVTQDGTVEFVLLESVSMELSTFIQGNAAMRSAEDIEGDSRAIGVGAPGRAVAFYGARKLLVASAYTVTAMNEYAGFHPSAGWTPDRIDPRTITPRQFFERYITTRSPVVLSPGPSSSLQAKWTLSYLKATAGAAKVKVEKRDLKTGGFGSGAKRIEMTFGGFLEKIEAGEEGLYLTTQYNEEDDDAADLDGDGDSDLNSDNQDPDISDFAPNPLPALLKDIPLRQPILGPLIPQTMNLWVGSAKNFTSSTLHHDFQDNLYLLLKGTKKFTVFSPKDTEKLYTYGIIERVGKNGYIHYTNRVRDDGADSMDVAAWKVQKAEQDVVIAEENDGQGLAEAELRLEEAMKELLAVGGGESGDTDSDDDGDLLLEDENSEESGAESEDAEEEQTVTQPGNKRSASSSLSSSATKKSRTTQSSSPTPADVDTPPASFSRIPNAALHAGAADGDKLSEFPLLEGAAKITFTLEAGEALYLPVGWFHEVASRSEQTNKKGEVPLHVALNYWLAPPTKINSDPEAFANCYEDNFWKNVWEDTEDAIKELIA